MKVRGKVTEWKGKIFFGVVLVVALIISWWSLYTLAVDFFGVPRLIAAGVSIAFDGAALYVADLASKYAKSEDSALASRMATYVFVAASAFLNVEHARLMHFGPEGMVFFGSPPVIAGILFELYLKYTHRQELRARGRVAQSMPVFGKLSWLVFPKRTWKGFCLVLSSRLDRTVVDNVFVLSETDRVVLDRLDKTKDKLVLGQRQDKTNGQDKDRTKLSGTEDKVSEDKQDKDTFVSQTKDKQDTGQTQDIAGQRLDKVVQDKDMSYEDKTKVSRTDRVVLSLSEDIGQVVPGQPDRTKTNLSGLSQDKTSLSTDEDMSGTRQDRVVPVVLGQDKSVRDKGHSVSGQRQSVSGHVRELWDKGVTDRTQLRQIVSDAMGRDVPMGTIAKAVSRIDKAPGT